MVVVDGSREAHRATRQSIPEDGFLTLAILVTAVALARM